MLSIIPVVTDEAAIKPAPERLREDGISTHWPSGTPNTGPLPDCSLDLSEKQFDPVNTYVVT